MNPDRLFADFDRLSEAPDAVPRLRRFILDVAVRGKLVEQDPADEAASEILEAASSPVLPGGREGRLSRVFPARDEIPFSIPPSWLWCRLNQVGLIVGGGTPPSSDGANFALRGMGTPWLTPTDMRKHHGGTIERGARDLTPKGLATSSATLLPRGTVLFTSRAPIGYVAIASGDVTTNQGFKSLVPSSAIDPGYAAIYFRAFLPRFEARAPGTTFKEVSGKLLSTFPFPLPPIAEQHRIVAKVNELIELCDRLEAAQAERECRRDRLLASTVTRLCDPSTETSETRFEVGHSSRLLTRPASVTVFRQAILDLAVSGRLSSPHSSDEPVTALTARLKEEGRSETRRRRGGSAQSDVPLLPIRPTCWDVVTVRALSESIDYGTSVQASRDPAGIPILRMGNLAQGRLHFTDLKYLRHEELDERLLLRPGDLLFNRTNSAELVGKTAVFHGWKTPISFASYLIRVRPLPSADMRWVHLFLSSTAGKAYLAAARSQQTGQANINGSKLAAMPIPLPPVTEQRRIIARAEELIAVCDELARNLAAIQTRRARLLEAVLREALGEDSKTPQRELVRTS